MQQAEQVLGEIESLLDQLIDSAQKLLTVSQQVMEEEELTNLQKDQEALLEKLIEKDAEFHKFSNITQEKLLPRRLKIDEKIDHFQKLNSEFVDNISSAHGVIQFKKPKEE